MSRRGALSVMMFGLIASLGPLGCGGGSEAPPPAPSSTPGGGDMAVESPILNPPAKNAAGKTSKAKGR